MPRRVVTQIRAGTRTGGQLLMGRGARLLVQLGLLATGGGVLGCRDVVGAAALPPGTQSPATYNTPEGALAMYRTVKMQSRQVLWQVILAGGGLADELLAATVGTSPQSIGATGDLVDERIVPEGEMNDQNSNTYDALHVLRGDARQAIGLLVHYAPNTSPALQGEMYALLGYAELQLAELYCNGVPLSTLDFEQDFTYKSSSTTQEVLEHVVVLEDTALALSTDSAWVLNLARVLKGRALLQLGRYAEAAQAVAAVPDTFTYKVPVQFPPNQNGVGNAFLGWTVADTEGTNGLPFVSRGDPRVLVTPAGSNLFGRRLFTPTQYQRRAGVPDTVVLASGVEARLIEAEAALKAGRPEWLTILNALRTNGTVTSVPAATVVDTLGVTGCPNADGSACGAGTGGGVEPQYGQPVGYAPAAPGSGFTVTRADTTYQADQIMITSPSGDPISVRDYCNNYSWYDPCWADYKMVVLTYVRPASTTWNAGSGGVAGLALLSDPGAGLSGQAATDARVDLLFRERAYWLFLTGHRQGDLRRLVRTVDQGGYGWRQNRVYPTGPYYGGRGAYGSDVNLPIPSEEHSNPLFHGCLGREA